MSAVRVKEVGNEREFIGTTVYELRLNGDVEGSGGGGRKGDLSRLRSMSYGSMAMSAVQPSSSASLTKPNDNSAFLNSSASMNPSAFSSYTSKASFTSIKLGSSSSNISPISAIPSFSITLSVPKLTGLDDRRFPFDLRRLL
ncbi:hypothetical protein V6N12_024243 [Hibiscus sabdariffa]|uniref:Uncharacterized protein n=1 Tax=Hibiscus sabdariffa TaxID=183260 RepID=A0ABR2G073_9ROSI